MASVTQGPRWRRAGAQRGQALVEVALLLPILLLMGLATATGSQLLSESIVLRSAAREGALAAAAYLAMPNAGPTNLPPACAGGLYIANAQGCAAYRAQQAGAPITATVTLVQVNGASSGLLLAQVTVAETVQPVGSFFGAQTLQYAASAAVPQ